ncbi:amidohydrolase family protein [Helicobacter canis]|uniref:Amidohydrolase n=1 Tax=Helicobacter canis TaxID=29419 RepID=A0A377J3H5_9HELI|nr:amidohydrolase family protein [Helicobacter canis]STO96804.1 amidohydrolase [Helicobacter canis]
MKIIGASVVFVCDREFRIIRDGGVVYEGERIVEVGGYEELVAKYTKSPSDSKILELESTFLNNAEKIQSIASLEKVDSSCEAMDCHADFQSARNDRKNAANKKVDSRNAQNLHKQADSTFLSSRDFRKEVVAIHKGAKADSRACGKKADSKEKMDCHATATQWLAMTENNAISENAVFLENKRSGASVSSQVSLEKVDSRENAESLNTPQNAKAENVFDSEPQAEGFCDDFAGCARRAVGEGIYLSGNEQAHRAESTKSAEKPTPTLETEFFSGCVLLPALINAHIHFEFSSNSTSFAYGSFEGWLASVMSKRDSVLADMPTAIESTIDEQLDSGVGSVGAISSYGADMQALAKSALKVVYFSEAIGANPAALDTLLADVKARFYAAKKLSSRSFFPALALHAPYSVHSVLAKHIIAFAKEAFSKQALESTRPAHTINNPINNPCEMSCTLSAHFLESNAERVWLESKDRASAPKGWFYDFYTQVLKIPSPAPYYTPQEFMELFSSMRTSFVHCTALHPLESTFLAQQGHSLITCPRSNRLLNGSMLDLKKLDSSLVENLGIGSDGASSNANTNMLDELRAGLFGMDYDLPRLARLLLLAATRGNAKALGLANGTLESGKSADMAVFEIKGIKDSTQPEVHFILLADKVRRLLINGEQVR